MPFLSRREILAAGLSGSLAAALPWQARAEAPPVRGGQLIIGFYPDPPTLTSAITVAGPTQMISGKIFDGLITYDRDLTLRPQLAERWSVAPDGLSITFNLRTGVTWHDGKPFTSADVAYSVLEIWKKFHSRGRSTFANVVAAETPDPLTVTWRLSRPAPYILNALASIEAQILPRHLYEGTDVLANPHNAKPVGTGPFRFAAWESGSHIVLERNPTYWDQPKPYLDRVIYRILPDAASRAAALETGEIHAVIGNDVSFQDVARIARLPDIDVTVVDRSYVSGVTGIDFNLDRPIFKDVRVRRAFAHAIDRDFIVRNIWSGYAVAATGPIPPGDAIFYTGDVPAYPFDLAKAAALLDEAGYPPGPDGVRFSITHDPVPIGEAFVRTGEYLRDTLGKIGVKVTVRAQDFASFLRRVYTERDFDTAHFPANSGPDPAIGVQRLYWSKNFERGVAFSNGSHYASPEADRLLEAAQVELDPHKRTELYHRFQALVQTDLPRLPLVAPKDVVLTAKRLHGLVNSAADAYGNFADAYFSKS